jgi:hypothetical protein
MAATLPSDERILHWPLKQNECRVDHNRHAIDPVLASLWLCTKRVQVRSLSIFKQWLIITGWVLTVGTLLTLQRVIDWTGEALTSIQDGLGRVIHWWSTSITGHSTWLSLSLEDAEHAVAEVPKSASNPGESYGRSVDASESEGSTEDEDGSRLDVVVATDPLLGIPPTAIYT